MRLRRPEWYIEIREDIVTPSKVSQPAIQRTSARPGIAGSHRQKSEHITSKIIFSLVFAAFLISACAAAALPQLTRKTLDKPTEIQGYPCQKGYAWFHSGGHLQKCTVAREVRFGETTVPAGSMIALRPDGKPDYAQMASDSDVLGIKCMGSGWLGVAEGSVVGFYPNGKVKVCFLAEPQTVQGVPCSEGGFWSTLSGGDPGVYFHENGKLKRCRLAQDYAGLRKETIFTQTQ